MGTDEDIYFTPLRVCEFVMGSGAFLQNVAELLISNPPFGIDKKYFDEDTTMRTYETKTEQVHFEPMQFGLSWAVVKVCSDGRIVKVTEPTYNESQARDLARRLNRE